MSPMSTGIPLPPLPLLHHHHHPLAEFLLSRLASLTEFDLLPSLGGCSQASKLVPSNLHQIRTHGNLLHGRLVLCNAVALT